MGQGQATVYNDEVIIPSLIQFGIPEKLAYSYTNDGCTEIMLDGYSGIVLLISMLWLLSNWHSTMVIGLLEPTVSPSAISIRTVQSGTTHPIALPALLLAEWRTVAALRSSMGCS